MRYVTQEEVLARRRQEQLLHLARAGDGTLDIVRLDQAITDAEADVTSLLLPRYREKLPTTPAKSSDQLKSLVAGLVAYHLGKGAAAIPQSILDEYDRTMTMLRAIGRNAADLDLVDQPTVDNSTPIVRALRPATDAALTLEKLKGW